jgi:hypothetical protein
VRTAAGVTLRSGNGGATFAAMAGNPPLGAPPVTAGGGGTWSIDAQGHVRYARRGPAPARDPRSPGLGAGAHLIGAVPGVPGAVVAVAADGTVWRRGQDGDWRRALLLLPAGLTGGVPAITSLTVFDRPVTEAVYLGTTGYSVLVSTDGGDDWIRAGPGLPDSVYGLASDARTRTVYAATSDGLWAHRVQAFPQPPAYRDAALALRWIGIALVALFAALVSVVVMARLTPSGDATRRPV